VAFPVKQVAVTDPLPALVEGPITHVHDTVPSGPTILVALVPWPCAVLFVPAGVTY
jgi:hypothetical protein